MILQKQNLQLSTHKGVINPSVQWPTRIGRKVNCFEMLPREGYTSVGEEEIEDLYCLLDRGE